MLALRTFNDWVEWCLSALIGGFFAAFILVVLMQVAGRNLFTSLPVLWAMDAALLLFVWSVFVGSAIALRRRSHYMIELFPPEFVRVNAVLQILSGFALAVAVGVLIYAGFTFLPSGFTRSSLALGISEGYFFLSIPVAAVFMGLFLIEVMLDDIRRAWKVAQDTAAN